MLKDIMLVKPVKEYEKEFIMILAKKWQTDDKLLQSLKDYFKDDFYLIMSLFAGKNIAFPKLVEVDELKKDLKVFFFIEDTLKLGNKEFSDVLNIASEKFHMTWNQCYVSYKEMKEQLRS